MQTLLITWFSLTAISVAFVTYDLIFRTPEMKVMKWGWVMVTLYTGLFGLVVYILSCREPSPGTHEKFIAPLWKQTVGSTIHCMAGDATGVIVVAFITALLNLPMGIDAILEYIAGFAFGLFIFQSLFMKDMFGGSYTAALRKTWYPEWVSMNFVMAGMIPIMIILMTKDMRNMDPLSLRFWGIMSLASVVGGILAIPVNWWMVKNKMKHGMGTERAIGKGGTEVKPAAEPEEMEGMKTAHKGHAMPVIKNAMPDMSNMTSHEGHAAAMQPAAIHAGHAMSMEGMEMNDTVSQKTKWLVTIVSVIVLAIGIAAAGYWGDFSMRPEGDMQGMEMK